jgi:hypothetical protein
VVCRQLGYYGVKELKVNSFFGSASRELPQNGYHCEGAESNLDECQHFEDNSCRSGNIAGVVCLDHPPTGA